MGISSSSRLTSWRRMRLFAWPRSPSRMKLCRDITALTRWHYRLFVAHDAREQRGAVLEEADQVLPHLVLDGAVLAGGAGPFGLLEVAERGGLLESHGSTLTRRIAQSKESGPGDPPRG